MSWTKSLKRVWIIYFEMIFEKDELDQRGIQVALCLPFYTDNIITSTIFYLLRIQNPTPGTISL